MAGAVKASVTEFYADKGYFPGNNDSVGVASAASVSGQAVRSIQVGSSGVITVTFKSLIDPANNVLTLTPTAAGGTVAWDCKGGSLSAKYRPTNCRG
ncbi:pilin [Niveibacterium terrae]|uniref:pilin n=1 Tax=Niveibacterium terrae TaxID=3373598 RepID=UPI003A8E1A64